MSTGSTSETAFPAEAPGKGLKRMEGQENVSPVHHPDRGFRYAVNVYVSVLKQYGIRTGMTWSGEREENAQAESIGGTVKSELPGGPVFSNIEEVMKAVTLAAGFYGNEKPHTGIGMMTPGETENKGTGCRLTVIKTGRSTCVSLKKVYLCRTVRGLLPGYALQSTPDSDRAHRVNKYQV